MPGKCSFLWPGSSSLAQSPSKHPLGSGISKWGDRSLPQMNIWAQQWEKVYPRACVTNLYERSMREQRRIWQGAARVPFSPSLPELQNGIEHKMAIDDFLIQSSARKSPGWRKTTGQPFQGYRQAGLIVRCLSHPSFSFRVWEPSNCEPDLQRRPHCRTPLSSSLWWQLLNNCPVLSVTFSSVVFCRFWLPHRNPVLPFPFTVLYQPTARSPIVLILWAQLSLFRHGSFTPPPPPSVLLFLTFKL